MPSWKKVITSGSDAFLNSLNVTSNLTVSGSSFLGDSLSDSNIFTGSVSITGSLALKGPLYDNLNSSGIADQILFRGANGIEWRDNIANSAQDLVITGKNVGLTTIQKGTPLYFTGSGTSGNLVGILPADAGNPDRMPAGGVAAETITAGAEGDVFIYGYISGVDTSQFESGDSVFVAVGGGYTNVKPTGSALIQKLGNVEKVSDTNGSGVIQGPSWYNDTPNLLNGNIFWGENNTSIQKPLADILSGSAFRYSGSFTGSFSGSGENLHDTSIIYTSQSGNEFKLKNLEVLDYSNDVAVVYDEITDKLRFIFGTPLSSSITLLTFNSTFATDRFNLEGDDYSITGSWNNNAYSLISASLYTGSTLIFGVTNTGTTISQSFTGNTTYTTGSQQFRLEITSSNPISPTPYYVTSSILTGTLSKISPTNPTQTETATVQLGASSNQIEQGATGSIVVTATTGSNNRWTLTSFTTTGSFSSTRVPLGGNTNGSQISATFFVTSSATGSNNITIATTASYNSGTLNNPVITSNVFDSITYTKIRSLRAGASVQTSFTQAELENLSNWDTTLGGTIGTISKGTQNPNGASVSITWSGDKYQYIVYSNSFSYLTNIIADGFSVLSDFTSASVGDYKVYRTTLLQSGYGGTTQTYTLTI